MMPPSTTEQGKIQNPTEVDRDSWTIRLRRPIRRESSTQYMVILLVSFIASVSMTRLFLSVSGYPMIGSGELHIAHVLWGGLFLFVSTLLLLLFSNRQLFKTSAILAGIGIGLFIDEVGKFITVQNDYFFPAAAPIIYIFFILLFLLFIQLRRQVKPTPRAEFSRALETLPDWIDRPFNPKNQSLLIDRLSDVSASNDPRLASLANGILEVVQSDTRPTPVDHQSHLETYRQKLDTWFSEPGLRIILGIGFLIMALIALKNPVGDLLNDHLPDFWGLTLFGAHSGRWFTSETAPGLYQARIILEVSMGILLLVTAILFFTKNTRLAVPIGFGLLIIYLATIDALLFYFEQFSTIAFVFFQFSLITVLIYYRTRFITDSQDK